MFVFMIHVCLHEHSHNLLKRPPHELNTCPQRSKIKTSFMYLKSTQNILNLFSVSFCVSLSGKTWTSLCDNIHSLYNNIYIKCLWCEILIVLQPFCASAPVWNLKSHTGSIPALFGLKFINLWTGAFLILPEYFELRLDYSAQSVTVLLTNDKMFVDAWKHIRRNIRWAVVEKCVCLHHFKLPR